MRTKQELWTLVYKAFKNKIRTYKRKYPELNARIGICQILSEMRENKKITFGEYVFLTDCLYYYMNTRESWYNNNGEIIQTKRLAWIWSPWDRRSRLKWLRTQIAES